MIPRSYFVALVLVATFEWNTSADVFEPDITSPNQEYAFQSQRSGVDLGNADFFHQYKIIRKGKGAIWELGYCTCRPCSASWSPSSRFLIFQQLFLDRGSVIWGLEIEDNVVHAHEIQLDELDAELYKKFPVNLNRLTATGDGISEVKWIGRDKAEFQYYSHEYGITRSATVVVNFGRRPIEVRWDNFKQVISPSE